MGVSFVSYVSNGLGGGFHVESKLIQRAKEKDEAAFEEIIDMYKPTVERFVFQFGIDQANLQKAAVPRLIVASIVL